MPLPDVQVHQVVAGRQALRGAAIGLVAQAGAGVEFAQHAVDIAAARCNRHIDRRQRHRLDVGRTGTDAQRRRAIAHRPAGPAANKREAAQCVGRDCGFECPVDAAIDAVQHNAAFTQRPAFVGIAKAYGQQRGADRCGADLPGGACVGAAQHGTARAGRPGLRTQ